MTISDEDKIRGCREVENIVVDTMRVLSVAEMASRFSVLGKPTSLEDCEVSFDPDDYPQSLR